MAMPLLARLLLVLAAAAAAVAVPVAPGVYALKSVQFPLTARHCDFQLFGCTSSTPGPAEDFQFAIGPALNGQNGAVSFQSVNYPGYYIAPVSGAEAGRLGIVSDPPNADDASFIPVDGLQPGNGHYSFRSCSTNPQLSNAYLALDGRLQGGCSGEYGPPSSDIGLVQQPSAGNATFTLYQPPPPPPVLANIDATTPTHTVNRLALGCHSDSGYVHQARGFYAQMVFGESFEGNLPEHTAWTQVVTAQGTVGLDNSSAFHGGASMRATYTGGSGLVGVSNRGLGNEGLYFEGQKPYEGYFFAKSNGPVQVAVQLRDFSRNKTLASTVIAFAGGNWTMLNFTLTPSTGTQCVDGSQDARVYCGNMGPEPGHICVQCGGEIFVGLAGVGTANFDYIFLQPGAWGRFAGQSILQSTITTLQQMGITAIRLGGSFTIPDYYAWYNWIGAPWTRPSLGAEWGDELISGWGPFEFIDMCAAAGIEPIITISADSNSCCTPDQMADLVEYCYGNASTAWGATRISNGHPNPYPVRYIELGNEQYNYNYADQVAAMEQRAKQLGIGDTLYYLFPDNNNWLNPNDAAKVQALNLSDHVAMDEHVGAGGAIELAEGTFNAHPTLNFGAVNAETNAGSHHMTRAVQEAADLNDWLGCSQQACSRIHFRTASFCTERSGHYDNFDQGIAFFLPNMTWLQPPGYVHQMINQTFQPLGLAATLNDTTAATVSAQMSADGNTVVVRLTNSGNAVANAEIAIKSTGSFRFSTSVTIVELWSAEGGAANTPANPTAIAPATRTTTLPTINGNPLVALQPNSFTVLVFTKQ